ncbi:MAG: mannose-1-phosphate guanylyltransferase/mannose-6-phosphate isomerase [Thermodesulfobacteriota bacterium]
MSVIQPVILAGGTGSRLWPLSRELYPKQLLSLSQERSLLQATILRLDGLAAAPPIVIVGQEHRFLVQRQIEELALDKGVTILLEPVGRNTGPAVCAAAHWVAAHRDPTSTLLVLPADHLLRDEAAFRDAVRQATALAEQGLLVTFGIRPTAPETGYGYIEAGEGHRVRSFVEKPDRPTAEAYLAAGTYFWNSGMFAFSLPTLRQELARHAPQVLSQMEMAVAAGRADGTFFHLDRQAMTDCPSDSIDYCLMEKSDQVAVVPADLGWSDIGSWQALWEVSPKDGDGNVVVGDVMLEGAHNCLIRAEHALVAAVGLADTLVVETGDAVLVAPLDRSQDVKKIVPRLKAKNREEYRLHRTVYRPWGSYTLLEEQPRFKIKRITVNPGAKLSLQMHHHRSEHWVVVRGTARIVRGDDTFLLVENQSTYIPANERHRLENPGKIPLELIEVQNGSYLGEDDIVRLEDTYGRQD